MDKLPAQMTVIAISKPGGPEVLVPETRAVPAPGPDEILVKVAAAGVNRPDVAQRIGQSIRRRPAPAICRASKSPAKWSRSARASSKHKIGDKVMSLVAGGGYAQYCIAQEAQAMAVPTALLDDRSRRHAGNADDGVAQCVRARRR